VRTEAIVRAFSGLNLTEAAGEHVTTAYKVVWPWMVLESPPTRVKYRAQLLERVAEQLSWCTCTQCAEAALCFNPAEAGLGLKGRY
jgi:hypothetical protein